MACSSRGARTPQDTSDSLGRVHRTHAEQGRVAQPHHAHHAQCRVRECGELHEDSKPADAAYDSQPCNQVRRARVVGECQHGAGEGKACEHEVRGGFPGRVDTTHAVLVRHCSLSVEASAHPVAIAYQVRAAVLGGLARRGAHVRIRVQNPTTATVTPPRIFLVPKRRKRNAIAW